MHKEYECIKRIMHLLAFLLTMSVFGATFNNQMTLAQFNTTTNQNVSLQVASIYTYFPFPQSVRTNDFQTLQLSFGDYATARLPCRVGLFNVSECSTATTAATGATIPFGTQLSLPSVIFAGDQNAGIEPNRNLIEPSNPNYLVFSYQDTVIGVVIDMTESTTFTTFNTNYVHNLTEGMRNINLPCSGYHDFRYEKVVPRLAFGSGILIAMEIDNVAVVLPTAGTSINLVAGTKFKFVLVNPTQYPAHTQTWFVYAQSDTAVTPIRFLMNYTLTSDDRIQNVNLISQSGSYTGYLRAAAIQTSLPHATPNSIRPRTAPQWQLATQIQSLPATPLSMFMLWPYDWTKKVGPQLVFNQNTNVFTSSCSTNSLLIPLLARSNFETANCWYNQLIDKQNAGQQVFDIGTNSFVTLFNMLVAHYYDADISNYQSTIARGVSTPNLGIQPSAVIMEQMFDAHRSEVVESAELEFNSDGSYQFFVSTLDSIATFPKGSAALPLFSFLGYQTLADGFNIINSATNRDPIKGDINYVEGNIANIPGSYLLKFKGQDLPTWAGRFIPDDFWLKLRGLDKTSLLCQLNKVLNRPLPGYDSSTYQQGKILFQLAMTAKYATYLLLAQQGRLPPYPPGYVAPASVSSRVQPLIDRIEDLLDTWLITRTFEGSAVPNYLVGDILGLGIVAYTGTTSSTGGTQDSGNAVYTGHNRQYGYFLGAAAIAIELDRLFNNTPWIASSQTNVAPASFTGKTKQFVDMLWRDYANPAEDDAGDLPFYRYGNQWEGISSSKGLPPTGAYPSRNNESISEDFNGYYGSYLYARAIENTPTSVISAADQQGFNILEYFSKANLAMIMRGARALFYNNENWVYKNTPFNFNQTTGTEWDNMVDSGVAFSLGSPPCQFFQEGCLYSQYKFDLFCTDIVNQFNAYSECQNEGCSCQK
jgi:hypothetical protein